MRLSGLFDFSLVPDSEVLLTGCSALPAELIPHAFFKQLYNNSIPGWKNQYQTVKK